jgi:hypothetical protein
MHWVFMPQLWQHSSCYSTLSKAIPCHRHITFPQKQAESIHESIVFQNHFRQTRSMPLQEFKLSQAVLHLLQGRCASPRKHYRALADVTSQW